MVNERIAELTIISPGHILILPMKRSIIFIKVFVFVTTICFGQKWDDTLNMNWPAGFNKIELLSTADNSLQPSIFYKSSKSGQPLIVSLHTWSGDFTQLDSISWEIKDRDWNYIHPNFRGPNFTEDACGSDLVIADIEDAIHYAIKETGANPKEVHIIGVSGGGHAAMMCYMKLKYPVKSFSSWVGVSNLKDWYFENLGRGQHYATDILRVTGDSINLNEKEAEKLFHGSGFRI